MDIQRKSPTFADSSYYVTSDDDPALDDSDVRIIGGITTVDLGDALRALANYVFKDATDENRDRFSEMKIYDILAKVAQRYPRE